MHDFVNDSLLATIVSVIVCCIIFEKEKNVVQAHKKSSELQSLQTLSQCQNFTIDEDIKSLLK